jgi:hypothetical protein
MMSTMLKAAAPNAKVPALRKLRREMPSQYRLAGPGMFSMESPFQLVGRNRLAFACPWPSTPPTRHSWDDSDADAPIVSGTKLKETSLCVKIILYNLES